MDKQKYPPSVLLGLVFSYMSWTYLCVVSGLYSNMWALLVGAVVRLEYIMYVKYSALCLTQS